MDVCAVTSLGGRSGRRRMIANPEGSDCTHTLGIAPDRRVFTHAHTGVPRQVTSHPPCDFLLVPHVSRNFATLKAEKQ